MNTLKVLALIGVVALSYYAFTHSVSSIEDESSVRQLWSSWKRQYGVTYSTQQEDNVRFEIFAANHAKVQRHNSEGHRYTLALNKFADLTGEEFKATYASCRQQSGIADSDCPSAVNCPSLPETNVTSVNWTTSGAVTPIKNQGQCGSCWAFSSTGSLEGLYYLNHSLLVSFSEQQIIDCDKDCQGCNGCFTYLAMEYTAKNGIEPEAIYPYKGVNGECKYNAAVALHANTGYQCVQQKSVSQLEAAVVNQPVSVDVEADQNAWQLYSGGVVDTNCGDALDHSVLAAGYGSYEGTNAWYVKNSWGADWGMSGYIWISQDDSANNGYGVCGILRCADFPVNTPSQ